ncbi:receptor-binding cancer antigen expressed on SiSo cells-like [Mizuhopecten yessoensis]|uniref:Receptor-binding cancer antigen expressed on SiSo cell n=1 Tax=Mizuhopecten yessoensis TaxID=6573 RepID=A0A210PQV3_MIZYE|nr:receptor-binding cancer antigen expressed on SiSo cells-like [Mizuhopecten yessoensis]OWF38865.1 Receptor-binding cancer antigen expressed on SiSo cell [Mizuhopecten yessoensis]
MIKVVWNIIKKTFGFVLLICSPFKRLFCRRKRRTSDTVLPLTNHYSIPQDFTQTPSAPKQPELQSWENWDQDQSSNSRSLNHNYSRSRSLSHDHDELSEPEPDYFQDMTPRIKRQKKVLIKQKEEMKNQSNRFAMASTADVPLSAGPELGTWDDRQTGWNDEGEEDLSWQAEAAIKEQKRSERRERNLEQQRRKQEKESSKRDTFSAVRLS